ncbi:MAG: rod shape-determining protein MreD [Solirubrobacterales bacterium]
MSPEYGNMLLRLSALVIGTVIIQLAVITQFSFFGVTPDVIPVLVASIGLLGGATAGATSGFVAGFLIDLILLQTMGVSSLILTVGGYAAGRLRELRDPVHPLTNSAVGATASIYFVVTFGVMQFSLGQPAPQPWQMLWQVIMSGLFGAVLAPVVFRMARWALLPTLGRDDPMFRRRRATIATSRVLADPTINSRSRRRRISRARSKGAR